MRPTKVIFLLLLIPSRLRPAPEMPNNGVVVPVLSGNSLRCLRWSRSTRATTSFRSAAALGLPRKLKDLTVTPSRLLRKRSSFIFLRSLAQSSSWRTRRTRSHRFLQRSETCRSAISNASNLEVAKEPFPRSDVPLAISSSA